MLSAHQTKGSLKFLRESASRSEHELNRAGDLKFSLSSFDSKTKRIFVYRSQNSLCSFDLQLRPSSYTQLDLVVGKGRWILLYVTSRCQVDSQVCFDWPSPNFHNLVFSKQV